MYDAYDELTGENLEPGRCRRHDVFWVSEFVYSDER